jgi:D-hydroxyproline dehydrogenase subunit alpha
LAGHDPTVLVVGAGLAGLSAAATMAAHGPVTVVERLPAPGGQAGFESPEVRVLVTECRAAGVRLIVGSTALRWTGGRLLVVGPTLSTWLNGDWLVYAGGSRPATPAEIRLTGGRLAGIFSATVAHHLLDAGIVLGRRPVVSGHSFWLDLILPQLREQGAQPTVVGASSDGGSGEGGEWPAYRVIAVHGHARVERVTISDDRSVREIEGDALVLAGDLRPLRNVDGAIRDGSVSTSFLQPLDDGMDPSTVVKFARAEAVRIRAEMGAIR